VNTQLAEPFIAEVQDEIGHPLPGVSISWQIQSGGGQLSVGNTTTGSDGRAQTSLTLGTVAGTDNNIVNAVNTNLIGSPMPYTATALPDDIDHYDIGVPAIALISTNFDPTVEIRARDQFGNLVDYADNTIFLDAVEPDTYLEFGDGELIPASVDLVNGEVDISDMQYDTMRNIRLKVWDNVDGVDHNVSYSSVISVVDALGNCFGRPNVAGTLIIDASEIHYASDYPAGVIDCSEVDVRIQQGAVDTHIYLYGYDNGDSSFPDGDYGITILANSFDLRAGTILNLYARGYAGSRGPGAGGQGSGGYCAGGGAGHGGYGTDGLNGPLASGTPYGGPPNGDVFEPTNMGSGGGENGGHGGGALHMVVAELNPGATAGMLTIDGTINADGETVYGACDNCGGGAGGSVWIQTETLNGGGTVSANGGRGADGGIAGQGGGGSGGRISVEYEDMTLFSGIIYAHGAINGKNNNTAGPGTVYLEETDIYPDKQGDLYVDNNGKNYLHAGILESSCPDAPEPGHGGCMFNSITLGVDLNGDGLQGYGHLDILSTGSAVTLSSTTLTGDGTSDMSVYGITYLLDDPYTLTWSGLHIRGDIDGYTADVTDLDIIAGNTSRFGLYANTPWRTGTYTFNSMTAQNNGDILLTSYNNGDTIYTNDYGITLNLVDLIVDQGGELSADGRGYSTNLGPGSGGGYGAGHGGYGGNGAGVHDSVYEPIDLGSGGGAGGGGGALKFNISSTLTLDGDIHASVTSEGAGGSIWIDTDVLTGGVFGTNGRIYANGGTSSGANGGGGGRIAMYYNDKTGFDGTVYAYGGGYGGPGTVYWEHKGVDPSQGGYLYVDNNGQNYKHAGILESYCLETDPVFGCEFQQIILGTDLDGNGTSGYGHLDFEGINSMLTLSSSEAVTGDGTSELNVYGLMNFDIDPPTDPVIIQNVDVGIYGDIAGADDLILRNNGKMTFNARTARRADRGITPINEYTFSSITVEDTGRVNLISYDDLDTTFDPSDDFGISFVLDSLDIQTGGLIQAIGGYGRGGYNSSNRGPGGGNNCSAFSSCYGGAGTYGGYGQRTTKQVYGSVYEPQMLGSSGGCYRNISTSGLRQGGLGGGAVKFDISGTMNIDGTLQAPSVLYSYFYDGAMDWESGSGGSIWIDTGSISGSGYINANGGTNVGHGAGGRIALYYENNIDFNLIVNEIAENNHIQSYGNSGGPGTIYVEQKTKGAPIQYTGNLYVSNNGTDASRAGLIEDTYEFGSITLTEYGDLDVVGINSAVTLSSTESITGDGTSTFRPYGLLTMPSVATVELVTVDISGDLDGGNDFTLQNDGNLILHAWTAKRSADGVEPINRYTFGDFTINPTSTLTLASYDNGDTNWTNDYGIDMYFDQLTVEENGHINGDGLGYTSDHGPGNGNYSCNIWCGGSGGAYGGYGGASTVNYGGSCSGGLPYGNVYNGADHMGSGGGGSNSGSGGSAITLAGNTLILDGSITSNGVTGSNYGAGSGGGIHVDITDLQSSGTGYMQVNGGAGTGDNGDGSGGRMSLYFDSNSGFIIDGDHLQARNASNSVNNGGGGTVYVENRSVHPAGSGMILVDNNSSPVSLEATIMEGDYSFSSIVLERNGHLSVLGENSSLTLTSGNALIGDSTSILRPYGLLTLPDTVTVDSFILYVVGDLYGGRDLTLQNNTDFRLYAHTTKRANDGVDPINRYDFETITIESDSDLILNGHDDGDSTYTLEDDYGVVIATTGDVEISPTGTITADFLGYGGSRGPGAGILGGGLYPGGGGGGHGGYGSEGIPFPGHGGDGIPGEPYGDIWLPLQLGSGGGGPYAGGGAIHLMVGGTLEVLGEITADGQGTTTGTSRGGGSGGSILIDTNALSGSGIISVDGGAIPTGHNGWGGGGAGGRIAIYYDTSSFNGTTHAFGGIGNANKYGGGGTIYIEDRSEYEEGIGDLYIDNNSRSNAAYTMDFEPIDYYFRNVTIGNYVKSHFNSDSSSEDSRGPHIDLTGDFTLSTGAMLDGHGKGYSSTLGPEPGATGAGNGGGGGGGHGGAGGVGQGDEPLPNNAGGSIYDSVLFPVNTGSGGGNGGTGSAGGSGGGAVSITTQNGSLTIDGTIDMHGGNSVNDGTSSGGGGGGGTIYFKGCDININATGLLDVSGGDAPESVFWGGGGGGGIISFGHTCTDTITIDPASTIDYSRGEGFQAGGVGVFTMYGAPAIIETNQFRYQNHSIIAIGEIIDERHVRIRAWVTDADTHDVLTMEVELKPAGKNVPWDNMGVIHSEPMEWTLGEPILMEVIYTDAVLRVGQSYKWRIRIRDDSGAVSPWYDFGENADLADFTIADEWAPLIPSNMIQYRSDESTVIPTGGVTDETEVVLKATLDTAPLIGSLTPEFEVREIGVAFQDIATHIGELDTWLVGDIIGSVRVSGLRDQTNYHWQMRSCNGLGVCSSWTSYGGNTENEVDFGVAIPVDDPDEDEEEPPETPPVIPPEIPPEEPPDKLPESGDDDGPEENIIEHIYRRFETITIWWWLLLLIFIVGLIAILKQYGFALVDVPYFLQRLRLSTLYTLGWKSEGDPWGIVYDSVTKELLSRCVVRLHNSSGELVDTSVTDISGVFNFEPRSGTYQIEVSRSGYYFPSEVITGTMDGVRKNVYHGEPYEVAGDKEPVRVYVPIDKEGGAGLKGFFIKITSFLVGLFMVLSPFLLIIGMILSYVYWVRTEDWFNLVMLAGYLTMLGLLVYGWIREKGSWGQVLDMELEPVPGVTVGLYDPVYDRLIDTRVSDTKGRFRFVVPGGQYVIKVEGTDYVLSEPGYEAGYVVGSDTDRDQQITEKVVVRKTRDENK
jgi:hypothetical protein